MKEKMIFRGQRDLTTDLTLEKKGLVKTATMRIGEEERAAFQKIMSYLFVNMIKFPSF